jgi:hypothetical protein
MCANVKVSMEGICAGAQVGLSSRVPDAAFLTAFNGIVRAHKEDVVSAEDALNDGDMTGFWRHAQNANNLRAHLDTLLSQTAIGRAVKASTTT